MGGTLGFFIEGVVALLLIVTIGYCVLVNRKLESLRSDQSELRRIIRELNAATGQAESAIAMLRTTATEAQESIDRAVSESREVAAGLQGERSQADALFNKLVAITRAHRQASGPAEAPAAPAGGVSASAVGIGLLNAQARAATMPQPRRRSAA